MAVRVRFPFRALSPKLHDTFSCMARTQVLRAVLQNYFQALEINFRSLEIYFSALEIYFRATEKSFMPCGGGKVSLRRGIFDREVKILCPKIWWERRKVVILQGCRPQCTTFSDVYS